MCASNEAAIRTASRRDGVVTCYYRSCSSWSLQSPLAWTSNASVYEGSRRHLYCTRLGSTRDFDRFPSARMKYHSLTKTGRIKCCHTEDKRYRTARGQQANHNPTLVYFHREQSRLACLLPFCQNAVQTISYALFGDTVHSSLLSPFVQLWYRSGQ